MDVPNAVLVVIEKGYRLWVLSTSISVPEAHVGPAGSGDACPGKPDLHAAVA